MWQTCPVCEGTGVKKTSTKEVCEVCNGKKIINSTDGTPPNNNRVNESNQFSKLLLS